MEMEMNAIYEGITTVGYPIFISLILMWYVNNENKKTQTILNELNISVKLLSETIKTYFGRSDENDIHRD